MAMDGFIKHLFVDIMILVIVRLGRNVNLLMEKRNSETQMVLNKNKKTKIDPLPTSIPTIEANLVITNYKSHIYIQYLAVLCKYD